jgi:hypothetical protein
MKKISKMPKERQERPGESRMAIVELLTAGVVDEDQESKLPDFGKLDFSNLLSFATEGLKMGQSSPEVPELKDEIPSETALYTIGE